MEKQREREAAFGKKTAKGQILAAWLNRMWKICLERKEHL